MREHEAFPTRPWPSVSAAGGWGPAAGTGHRPYGCRSRAPRPGPLGGQESLVELEQIATARNVVCVRQPRGETELWTAWVPTAVVEPVVAPAEQDEWNH